MSYNFSKGERVYHTLRGLKGDFVRYIDKRKKGHTDEAIVNFDAIGEMFVVLKFLKKINGMKSIASNRRNRLFRRNNIDNIEGIM